MRTSMSRSKGGAPFLASVARSGALACCVGASILLATNPAAGQAQPSAAPSAISKAIGAIKTINGTTITVTPESGPDVNIAVQPATQILRIAPGEKSLSNAAPIQLQDLQVGDRIRVTGKLSDDAQSLVAAKIVAIKHSDLDARHQQDLQDWKKRGVDGLAIAVDPSAGTVTITARNKSIVIHSAGTTVIRRYPPDSVKFDDATPGTLKDVHPGDQVRARGERSTDGNELVAEEIVSGSFRNIAGTINSVDASASSLSVYDLLSKKNLLIKITPDSQLRQLPPEMAQRIAARLKGGAVGAATASASGSESQTPHPAGHSGGSAPDTAGPGGRSGGAPDFQQMLSRIPAASLADLHKGDAVIVVSTEGTEGAATAITLLSGVGPILQAAPGASSSSILSPWSLSAPAGDSGGP
jgi:hypothetical protein